MGPRQVRVHARHALLHVKLLEPSLNWTAGIAWNHRLTPWTMSKNHMGRDRSCTHKTIDYASGRAWLWMAALLPRRDKKTNVKHNKAHLDINPVDLRDGWPPIAQLGLLPCSVWWHSICSTN